MTPIDAEVFDRYANNCGPAVSLCTWTTKSLWDRAVAVPGG